MTNYDEQIWKLMEESAAVAHLTTVKNTAELFRANGEELLAFVEWAANPYVATEMWAVKNRDRLRTAQVELGRLLFNFVASAVTMQKHVEQMAEQRIDIDEEVRDRVHELFRNHYAEEE